MCANVLPLVPFSFRSGAPIVPDSPGPSTVSLKSAFINCGCHCPTLKSWSPGLGKLFMFISGFAGCFVVVATVF